MCTQNQNTLPIIIITSPKEPAEFCYVPKTVQENLLTANFEQWSAIYSTDVSNISLNSLSNRYQQQQQQQQQNQQQSSDMDYDERYDNDNLLDQFIAMDREEDIGYAEDDYERCLKADVYDYYYDEEEDGYGENGEDEYQDIYNEQYILNQYNKIYNRHYNRIMARDDLYQQSSFNNSEKMTYQQSFYDRIIKDQYYHSSYNSINRRNNYCDDDAVESDGYDEDNSYYYNYNLDNENENTMYEDKDSFFVPSQEIYSNPATYPEEDNSRHSNYSFYGLYHAYNSTSSSSTQNENEAYQKYLRNSCLDTPVPKYGYPGESNLFHFEEKLDCNNREESRDKDDAVVPCPRSLPIPINSSPNKRLAFDVLANAITRRRQITSDSEGSEDELKHPVNISHVNDLSQVFVEEEEDVDVNEISLATSDSFDAITGFSIQHPNRSTAKIVEETEVMEGYALCIEKVSECDSSSFVEEEEEEEEENKNEKDNCKDSMNKLFFQNTYHANNYDDKAKEKSEEKIKINLINDRLKASIPTSMITSTTSVIEVDPVTPKDNINNENGYYHLPTSITSKNSGRRSRGSSFDSYLHFKEDEGQVNLEAISKEDVIAASKLKKTEGSGKVNTIHKARTRSNSCNTNKLRDNQFIKELLNKSVKQNGFESKEGGLSKIWSENDYINSSSLSKDFNNSLKDDRLLFASLYHGESKTTHNTKKRQRSYSSVTPEDYEKIIQKSKRGNKIPAFLYNPNGLNSLDDSSLDFTSSSSFLDQDFWGTTTTNSIQPLPCMLNGSSISNMAPLSSSLASHSTSLSTSSSYGSFSSVPSSRFLACF